jgi:hypothetical protein
MLDSASSDLHQARIAVDALLHAIGRTLIDKVTVVR